MVKNNQKRPEGAFTLIELLVVISIISLLSSVVLSSLGGAREDARQSAAMAELDSLRTGIELMLNDTGKWPNGCPPSGGVANPEVNLNNPSAGLLSAPSVGNQGSGCIWTSQDVQRWNGPYVNSNDLLDAVGSAISV
jgi:prepilin-type N-terminal cleavage/methylation domain-containing protein